MNSKSNIKNIISWIFAIIIFTIGVLNLFLVHPVPGIFYILLSLLFIPFVNNFIKKKLGSGIPFAALVIFFLIIMWGTLAITDLAEMAGL